jgi:RsiW-degrading membrane proteinase PrsW (M82 family)
MDLSQFTPAFKIIDNNGIFIGDLFGFILALPISLFLVYWISAVVVKNIRVVVMGAFLGAFLGFVIILGWAGTLIYDQPLPGANGGTTFFGSVLFCSVTGLIGGMACDLLVARMRRQDYGRAVHGSTEA